MKSTTPTTAGGVAAFSRAVAPRRRKQTGRRDFVVYEILYPNGKRYIGKDGNWPCRRKYHIRESAKTSPNMLCEKKMAQYGWVHIAIIARGLTEKEANLAERFFIKLFRANICQWGAAGGGYNRTNGGDGSSGYVHTEEVRRNQSIRSKNMTPENRQKLLDACRRQKGKKLSETAKLNIAAGARRRFQDPEERRKLSEAISKAKRLKPCGARRGHNLTDDHKRKISETMRDRTLTPEHCRSISEGLKNKPHSPEHCRRISEALKRRNAAKKNV